jgi:hypothetical protein
VWAASVTTTGMWPPGPPYESYLKAHASYCQHSYEDPTAPFETEVRSRRIDLKNSGFRVVTMPIAQRAYSFPMLQWVGNWWDH